MCLNVHVEQGARREAVQNRPSWWYKTVVGRAKMGLLRLFHRRGDSVSKDDAKKIEEVADICDESECCVDCSQEDADLEELDRIFDKLKIDKSEALFNTSKAPKIHFVVPTSQKDWEHDACAENDKSVEYKISEWCKSNGGRFSDVGQGNSFTTAVSSLPKDIMDIQVMRGTKNNVLVLPFFIWINDLEATKVDETLEELVPILLNRSVSREQLLREKPYLSEAREQAFVFICSHAKRDKRCGITAPYLKKTFDKSLQNIGLYRDISDARPNGVNVAFVNHVGGHKFAANLQLFVKKNNSLIWLARITPTNVPCVVDGIILPEKPKLPWPEKVRCIQKYPQW